MVQLPATEENPENNNNNNDTPVVETKSIQFTVLDKETKAAIGEATVKIGTEEKTTTAAQGKCTFTLEYGEYTISVTKEGYETYAPEAKFVVNADTQDTTIELEEE